MRISKGFGLIAFIALLLLVGAYYFLLRTTDRQIRISSNPWVGFTPFIYAQEKGWLESTPFRFMWLVDLSENARLYEGGFTKGFTATQYELLHFKDQEHIKPVFLIDRSAGADAIMSNRSLQELRGFRGSIPVYLELGSLHEDIFKAFVKENKLAGLSFSFKDSSQKAIAQQQPKDAPKIMVSYAPYTTELSKLGFITIASTRTLRSLFVIDALFIDERIVEGREQDFQKLRAIFNLAHARLNSDPHEFYNVIHSYLEGQTYDEFMATVPQIEWLNHTDRAPYLRQFQLQNIATNQMLP
ncbi:MAG: hypothetical protein Q8O24_00200 [Gallionellaceae bacterium]|nr:hypothetical protein [Gallionellaceae bacterium]